MVAARPRTLAVTVEPGTLTAPQGDTVTFTVYVEEFAGGRRTGTLETHVPPGWRADPPLLDFTLERGDWLWSGEFEVEVSVPQDADLGTHTVEFVAATGRREAVSAPVDLQVVAAPVVVPVAWGFDTDGDLEGWEPNSQLASVDVVDGHLAVRSTGSDPFLIQAQALALDASWGLTVEVAMRTSVWSNAQVYFFTVNDPFFAEIRMVSVTVAAGQARTYRFHIPPQDSDLTGLRFDPLITAGEATIEFIRIGRF